MPVYEGAVEAGVGSFMCSYNKINNVWSCENNVTLGTYMKVGGVCATWPAPHLTIAPLPGHAAERQARLDHVRLGRHPLHLHQPGCDPQMLPSTGLNLPPRLFLLPGLDQEMPGADFMGANLKTMVQNGQV